MSAEEQKVYIVVAGRKHWISDGAWITYHGFRWPQDLREIPRSEMEQIPEGGSVSLESAKNGFVLALPAESAATRYAGKFVRVQPPRPAHNYTYFVEAGRKRPLLSPAALVSHRISPADVIWISPSEFEAIPDGEPIP